MAVAPSENSKFDLDTSPDPSALPGGNVAETIVHGVVFYALIFCVIGLILAAGLWAVGSFSSNYSQSINGKKGFLICAGAALAIGAAKILVDWFYNAGASANGGTTDFNG